MSQKGKRKDKGKELGLSSHFWRDKDLHTIKEGTKLAERSNCSGDSRR